jgi:hypothetical protein
MNEEMIYTLAVAKEVGCECFDLETFEYKGLCGPCKEWLNK